MRPIIVIQVCAFMLLACGKEQTKSALREGSQATKTASKVPATKPVPPSSVPKPKAQALPTERRTLTLIPAELSYQEAEGTCTFAPNSRVKRARYTKYVLDLKSLETVLGKRPTTPVTVVVELEPAVVSTTKVESHLPQPSGGFQFTVHKGTVVGTQ